MRNIIKITISSMLIFVAQTLAMNQNSFKALVQNLSLLNYELHMLASYHTKTTPRMPTIVKTLVIENYINSLINSTNDIFKITNEFKALINNKDLIVSKFEKDAEKRYEIQVLSKYYLKIFLDLLIEKFKNLSIEQRRELVFEAARKDNNMALGILVLTNPIFKPSKEKLVDNYLYLLKGLKDYAKEFKIPLFHKTRKAEIIIKLLNLTNIDDQSNSNQDTLLIELLKNKALILAKFILEYDQDVNLKNKLGESALHWAIKQGYKDIVRKLIEKNANVNAVNIKQQTPLIIALLNKRLSMVKMLLKLNADVNTKTINNDTPLIIAVKLPDSRYVDLLLTNKSIDIDAKNDQGHTALSIALDDQNLLAADSLIENSATIPTESRYKNILALIKAAKEDY